MVGVIFFLKNPCLNNGGVAYFALNKGPRCQKGIECQNQSVTLWITKRIIPRSTVCESCRLALTYTTMSSMPTF